MTIDLGVHNLRAAYRAGSLSVRQVIDDVLKPHRRGGRRQGLDQRVPDATLRDASGRARRGRRDRRHLPLFGMPFAVKDNIDVAGLPTTAACPGFAYQPKQSAEVVQRLVAAGAIVIGKTNLDQFATGLVGVRSPYGVPRNPFDADYIPGGSSSGSAVAVAAGLVTFALGTDTAGSGRVPAGFNNIVGLKPTPRPAQHRGRRAGLPLARLRLGLRPVTAPMPISCSASRWRRSDADARRSARPSDSAFRQASRVLRRCRLRRRSTDRRSRQLKAMGGTAVEFDYAPFARPRSFSMPGLGRRAHGRGRRLHRERRRRGRRLASDARHHPRRTQVQRRRCLRGPVQAQGADGARMATRCSELDFLALPTAGTIYTIADLEREPVRLNSHLGHYTNFVNFFGLSGLAVPFGFRPDGLPFGITLIAHAYHDQRAARIRRALAARRRRCRSARPRACCRRPRPIPPADGLASRSPWSART